MFFAIAKDKDTIQEIAVSVGESPEDWADKSDCVCIKMPFNLEKILRADDLLLAHWESKPFYLDVDKHGKVVIRYIRIRENNRRKND